MSYGNIKLRPCPFCGNEADLETDGDCDITGSLWRAYVECTVCDTTGEYIDNPKHRDKESVDSCIKKACDAWNTRPLELPLDIRYHPPKARIIDGMESLSGGHTFTIEDPCPKCALSLDKYYENVPCLCDGEGDNMYQREITVPWALAKKIYQDFAEIALQGQQEEE